MKAAKFGTQILAAGLAVAALVLFFFTFANITSGSEVVKATGSELAFGATKTVASVEYKTQVSLYFSFAFVLTAITLLFSLLSFKWRRSAWGAVIFSVLSLCVHLAIFTVEPRLRVDYVPIPNVADVQYTSFYWIGLFVMLATLVITVVAIFIADYLYSKEHDKLPLFQKIKKFFRDYKSEIKKIVWPSRKTTIRNTIIVLVMCLVVGGFIWALDFGLAQLLKLVLQIDI